MLPDPFQPAIDEALPVVEARFNLLFTDTTAAAALIRSGLAFRSAQSIDNKIALFSKMNMFSAELLEAMLSSGESYKPAAAAFIWQRMVAHGLVRPAFAHMPGAMVDHQLDLVRILSHLRDDTFQNLFVPPAEFVSRYASSLVAIDVRKDDGTEARGSGFIAMIDDHAWLVTCRHNVDPDEGIVSVAISDLSGESLLAGKPLLSPDLDIAAYRINQPSGAVFRLSSDVSIFDEVFTLGFPYIPGAHPLIVGHRGEVNGVADLYVQKTPALLISNLVSPGSSGCPVLSRDGHCVGMTIRWLEAVWEADRHKFSAALPSAAIEQFVRSAH